MENEIEIDVNIVNLHYKVRGFKAIQELKEFLDSHANEVEDWNKREAPFVPEAPPLVRPGPEPTIGPTNGLSSDAPQAEA